APAPTGGGAELAAALGQILAQLVEQLGRERTSADAGGVSLGNTQHVVQVARPHAGAGGGAAGGGVGRGDIRIGAVVDVQQRALCALEQQALALLLQLVQDHADVDDQRLEDLGDAQ